MISLAAAIQAVRITNLPATPAPDDRILHTAQTLNGITEVGIVVSAIVATFIILTFYAQLQEFKLQRTIRLVDDFFNERLDGETTPSGALREGRRSRQSIEETLKAEGDRYAIISSYFDKALFMYENKMLNNEYFFGRMARAILRSRDEMKGLQTILAAVLPKGPSSMEILAVPARKYALKHGFLREAQEAPATDSQ